jgi:hypothetical protein
MVNSRGSQPIQALAHRKRLLLEHPYKPATQSCDTRILINTEELVLYD